MKPKEEPYTYFQPGEILFFLTDTSNVPINLRAIDLKTKQLIHIESKGAQVNSPFEHDKKDSIKVEKLSISVIDELINQSNDFVKKSKLTFSRLIDREIHFPGTLDEKSAEHKEQDSQNKRLPIPIPHGAFSLIPLKLLETVELQDGNTTKCYLDNSRLAELIIKLDDHFKFTIGGISLQAVIPNWLCSGESEWGGGGGPGGIPEPFSGEPDKRYPFMLTQNSEFESDFRNAPNLIGHEGEGVTVAILDTAPCLQDLSKAYERYDKVNPQNQKKKHSLIDSLLGPDGPLVVHPASIDELYRMRAVHLRDHDYEMTDHGLFVAGIIHSIAPKAKIHLYEVLNHQGVGDLLSIAHGLWEIYNSFSEPLIINSSLVLRIPRLNHPINDFEDVFLARIIEDWENNKKNWEKDKANKRLILHGLSTKGEEWLAHQGAAIEWICDHLFFRGSLVIAAAGNDWRSPDETRPSPAYPAAFRRVLGVGALPKNVQPNNNRFPVSSYSNLADEPNTPGVVTLGGEPGEHKGILGVYIGEFPDMVYRLNKFKWYLRPIMWLIYTMKWGNSVRPKNVSDWAWWCGTSFATPIIAGYTAATLSSLGKGARAQAAINKMHETNGILPSQTLYNEDGFIGVTQDEAGLSIDRP
jgi:hypothetical protein